MALLPPGLNEAMQALKQLHEQLPRLAAQLDRIEADLTEHDKRLGALERQAQTRDAA